MIRAVVLASLLLLPLQGVLSAQSAAARRSPGVSLQAGDAVRVQIWREEDLSGEFSVDEDGVVTLPLIGEKKVVGIPMRELRQQLIEDYRVHLKNPSINVTPLRRVNVLGEVQKPGLYGVDPTISLAGALAIAGGTTPMGDLNRIRILRNGQIIYQKVGAGETLNAADIRSGDQIIVGQQSWIRRNNVMLIGLAISATSLIVSLTSSLTSQ